jgi:hypothetical protein
MICCELSAYRSTGPVDARIINCMRHQLGLLFLTASIASACQSNGQTGSVGYYCSDTECAASAQAFLESLDSSRSYAPTFTGSICQDHPAVQGDTIHCQCLLAGVAPWELKKTGMPNLPCVARGRGERCILLDSEITYCDPADTNSCKDACDLLQSRLAEDATRTYDAQVRFARCVTSDNWLSGETGGGFCEVIARINGQCYGTAAYSGILAWEFPQDCALSDQQIESSVRSSVESAVSASAQGGTYSTNPLDGSTGAGGSSAGGAPGAPGT